MAFSDRRSNGNGPSEYDIKIGNFDNDWIDNIYQGILESETSDNSDDSWETCDSDEEDDEVEPLLVQAAEQGCLSVVEAVLEEAAAQEDVGPAEGLRCGINIAAQKKVEENWGRVVIAFGDTPLIRAANKGHFKVVKFLLEKGADPTLETESRKKLATLTVRQAVESQLKSFTAAKQFILNKNNRSPFYPPSFSNSPAITECQVLVNNNRRCKAVLRLIEVALKFWRPSINSKGRAVIKAASQLARGKPFPHFDTNQPSDLGGMVAALSAVAAPPPVGEDDPEVVELAAAMASKKLVRPPEAGGQKTPAERLRYFANLFGCRVDGCCNCPYERCGNHLCFHHCVNGCRSGAQTTKAHKAKKSMKKCGKA